MVDIKCVDFSVDSRWIIPVENGRNVFFLEKYKSMKKTKENNNNENINKDENNENEGLIFGEKEKSEILYEHTIGVTEDKICAILPTNIFYEYFEAKRRFNFLHKATALIPGLINCHTHMGMTILRGCVDDVSLKSFLFEFIWPIEKKFLNEKFVQISSQLAAYELLKNGTTMINDMYYNHEITENVCKDANIRIVTGEALISHDESYPHIDAKIKKAIEEAENDDGVNPMVRKAVVTHSLYTLEEESFRKVNENCKKKKIVHHLHLNETKEEVENFKTKHGLSTIDVLDRIGYLNEDLCAVHCVWLTENEMNKFAEKKVNVCHCPKSNLKLGSGICDVRSLIVRGVNVCIGTDSVCTNNSLDLLSEAKFACLLSKGSSLDSTAITSLEALKMITINGAKTLNRSHDLGSLEIGKLCDMVLIDFDDPSVLPIYNPISHLIYTENYQRLYVWVGGRLVVEDGKVLTVQPNLTEIENLAKKIKAFIYQRKTKRGEGENTY